MFIYVSRYKIVNKYKVSNAQLWPQTRFMTHIKLVKNARGLHMFTVVTASELSRADQSNCTCM